MTQTRGFRSQDQADNFAAAAVLHRRGGPLAPRCGAKTRSGGGCAQLPIKDGKGRCLKHAGPDAARAFRARQLRELLTGKLTPQEFAKAEARRARNHLSDAWKKNPSLPGASIDLGADEGRFLGALRALGVNPDADPGTGACLPAVMDWLRWRFRRTQIDTCNGGAWIKAVRQGLPRRVAVAERAMLWVRAGGGDKRTKAGRALKATLAAARSESQSGIASFAHMDLPKAADGLTGASVSLWRGREGQRVGKRALHDKPRAAPPPDRLAGGLPKRLGRPPKIEPDVDEVADLGALYRAGSAVLEPMMARCTDEVERLRVLQAFRAVLADPSNPAGQDRWRSMVVAFG
jgi:hypothetical protein